VSPSTVSDLNKKIYVTIEVRRNRPIEGEHPYVYLNGLGRTSYQRATSATLASGLKLAHLFLFPCNALTTRGDEWATQQQRAVTTDRKSKIWGQLWNQSKPRRHKRGCTRPALHILPL